MTALEDTITISARRRVPAGAAETFAFLAAPATHRRLQVRGIASLSLDDDSDNLLSGGAAMLRGPLGLRRTVHTRVALHQPPTRLAGSALTDSGTAAHISWTLREQPDGTTLVELTAVLGPITRGDRLLLAVGGRRWIRRLFAATLQRLAAELECAPRSTGTEPERARRRMGNCADSSGALFRPSFPARSGAGAV
jgi:polyketide cyclase/dehydrase/lipid transport protein